jgi:hypothetical protein
MTTGPRKLQDLKNREDDSKSLWKLPNEQYVIVSRIIAIDHGSWETIIFESDSTGTIRGNSLYENRTYESHSQSINNLMQDSSSNEYLQQA